MNPTLQAFARSYLKLNLVILPENHQLVFKRMYSPNDLSKFIDRVVDDMPEDRLDWAMEQVRRSLDSLNLQVHDVGADLPYAVVTFVYVGSGGPGGQQVGADGAGQYAVLVDSEADMLAYLEKVKCDFHVRKLTRFEQPNVSAWRS